jgi:hypothetical protein
MNTAQSIYDYLVNECGASFDVNEDVVKVIIASSVSKVLNAQIKHTAGLEKQLALAQFEVKSCVDILRASGFQGNTLSEIVDDLWKTATADREALTIAKHNLTVAQGALRAQDENHRAQLAALGLTERFPSLTHLADDMGEALLRAEKQITEIKQLLDLHCIHFSEIDPVERVKAVR